MNNELIERIDVMQDVIIGITHELDDVNKTFVQLTEAVALFSECKAALSEPVASSQDGWTFDELDLRGPADFETTPPEGWESSDWRTCLELKAELHNKKVYRAEIKRLRALITNQNSAKSVPQSEHDLQDVRCGCCGYMTYHREHMGCIRAAHTVPQDVELNQILGEYLTEELAAVAPDIDWYDGRYMNGLVSGILDVVMAGHARVPVEPTGKMWSAGRTAFDSVEDKVRYAMHSETESAHRDSAPTVIWQAMLTAGKESGQ